jgi:hypothetical protein
VIDMTDINQVRALKANCHAVFDTPQGKEVMRFLEISCRWYQSVFTPGSPDMTLINDGKRQVVATLKTILELSPEQISQLAQSHNA